jgi:transposase
VHKKTVVACVRRITPGGNVKQDVRTFGTMTGDLLDLSDWLTSERVTHVAMESTGAFWKPIDNILEGRFEHLEFLEAQVEAIGQRIEGITAPFRETIERRTTVPGIEQRTAENLVAEIATNREQFPSSPHLASWAGICPGNNESAGQRKTGKTPKVNRWLRRALTEAAWPAAHTKSTYFTALYRRISARRGKIRAIVAVGHTILTIAYHPLQDRIEYRELGADYFDRLTADRLTRYQVRKPGSLGYEVNFQPAEEAA